MLNIISDVSVNWHREYANDPDLVIHLAHEAPGLDQYRFDALELECGTVLYYGTCGQLVRFFAHDPSNESGFGGGEFVLTMHDGSQRTIRGPWSSRSSVMNEHGFGPCTEVTLREPGMRSGLCGAMKLGAARAAAEFSLGLELHELRPNCYGIRKSDMPEED